MLALGLFVTDAPALCTSAQSAQAVFAVGDARSLDTLTRAVGFDLTRSGPRGLSFLGRIRFSLLQPSRQLCGLPKLQLERIWNSASIPMLIFRCIDILFCSTGAAKYSHPPPPPNLSSSQQKGNPIGNELDEPHENPSPPAIAAAREAMANFPVNPQPFLVADMQVEHGWNRPARGCLALGGEPPREHEEYAIVTIQLAPQAPEQLCPTLNLICNFLEHEQRVWISTAHISPLGLGLIKLHSVV